MEIIQILAQFKQSIAIALGTIFVILMSYISGRREEKNNIKTKISEESLKNARESKKIANNISNLSDSDLDKRLQKYDRDKNAVR